MKVTAKSLRIRSAILLACSLLSGYGSSAQGSNSDAAIRSIERNKTDNTPTFISFSNGANLREDHAADIFRKYLGLDGIDNKMVPDYSSTAKSGVSAKRYHQYYKGVKADFASYSLSVKNGMIAFMTGSVYDFSSAPTPTPVVSESEAFAKALQFVGADRYMWQDPREEHRIKMMTRKPDTSFLPKGKLAWVEDFRTGAASDHKPHLAWSFDIYASAPLSRSVVYVDAATGKILLSNSLIEHTATTAYTRYSRSVPIESSLVLGTYELFDSTRGTGVHTLNMNNGSSYGAATEYTSASNTWPVASPDSIALDAHWGAEVVYDFWKTVMGRLSYDDADGILLQYVHYQSGYNNAFWDGSEMTYGDGTGCGSGFTPLTSLDVTGHEIGHGVCQYTAGLVYASESGAMNEAFSDCWGATIENWGDPHEVDAVAKSTWGIGEEIKCGNPMRRMDFPKLKGQPDTYGGTNWFDVVGCVPGGGNDNCGVHNNSGVMNKWYYLVVQGGSGTNDIGSVYSVTGIGFAEARNILYQTELVLSSTADFALMRTTSINTAITLYGDCSPEVVTVTNAWYAVGVGAAYVPYPAAITPAVNICVGGTASVFDATSGGSWTSSLPGIASVGTLSGIVNGISAGTAVITYSMSALCYATAVATVNAFPTATISPAPTALLCTGGTLTLTGSTGTGYLYQWKLGGSNIPGATNANYSATAGGAYTLVVSNSAGCAATSAATTVSTVAPPPATISTSSPTTFCAGSAAILNANAGSGFTYQWQLGGTPISGATSISFTATSGGNYTVVVTNSFGCSATSGSTLLTVTPLPTASVSPTGATTFCAPGSVLLNANTGVGITYQWQKDGVNIPGATASTLSATGTGSYVAVVTQSGCSASSTAIAVSAEALTIAPITGATSICIGQNTTLADATSGGSWSSSAPGIASVNSLGVVNGGSAGSVNIIYTHTNTCGTISTVNAMTVHAPTPVNSISGSLNVCQGSTSLLSDVTPSGVWSSLTPANATITGTGTVSGITAGTSLISYTVTNAFGCVSAAVATVSVNPLPSTVLSPAGTVAICPTGNITLSAPAGNSYQWQKGGVDISGANAATYSATSAGNYRAYITNSFGCSVFSAVVVVNVSTALFVTPAVDLTATPGNILCLVPSPVSFSATAVNGGSAPTFQWYVNGAGAGMGATFGYTPAAGDIVKCVVTSNDACASPDTGSSSMTMEISPMRTPSVSITDLPSQICTGNIVTFLAHPVYGGTAPIYVWTKNGTNVATGPEYIYIPSNGDNLVVSLTSNYPCLAVPSAISPIFHVVTHSPVANSVSIVVTQSNIVQGTADTFVASATNGGSAPQYQWLLNGAPIPGATASTYITSSLNAGDIISVRETSNFPCANPATAASGGVTVKITPVGVQQISVNGSTFSLSPNPNKGAFNIEGSLRSAADQKVAITVTDLLGQVVFSRTATANGGALSEHIVLGNALASGMYLLTITTEDAHVVYHMVLER